MPNQDSPDFVIIGGAHIDRIGRPTTRLEQGQSNPGILRRNVGGVAGNVARSLAKLDWKVALSTICGQDANATLLMQQLMDEAIDLSLTITTQTMPSATYTAIEERDGSLLAAIADMSIYDTYPSEQAIKCLKAQDRPKTILADTNLTAEAFASLAENKGHHWLAVCAVSGPKANRAKKCLHALDMLFCNEAEAAILADEFADPSALPEILKEEGVTAGVITRGRAGITAWQGEALWELPAPPVKVTSSNGAGDCLTACILHALQMNKPFEQALSYGMAGASLALMSEQSVPDLLSRAMLDACLADIPGGEPEA